MMTNTTPNTGSRVLQQWLSKQPGGLKRAGMLPVPARPLALRSYGAAQVSRLTQGWTTTSLSANAEIHGSLDKLRARSRQLARDNPHMRKFLSMVCGNVVGPEGFRLQSRIYDAPGKPDTGANDAVEKAWARWTAKKMCDVTGRLSFTGICHQLVRAAARDGEFLVRLVVGASARNPFGLALQVLDTDRIDTSFNRHAGAGLAAVRMGVEIDEFGRTLAYWLRTRHPGDLYAAAGQAGNERIRIPAEELVHGFVMDRPEQLRGVPWAHASMATLNNLGGYQEAAIVAARAGAAKMGFFTTPDGQVTDLADEAVKRVGSDGQVLDEQSGGGADLFMDADPGTFHGLPEGVQFQSFTPDYPAQMYQPFVQETVRDVATGMCVAYHSLGNNLEGVSFSSIRSGTLEERDQWMVLQAWFTDEFLEPIIDRWYQLALAMGQIALDNGSTLPVAKLDKFSAHTWQGKRWEWVDPAKDIEADARAIELGLKSPQSVCAKMGLELEDVLLEIKQAQDMAKRIGVDIDWVGALKAAAAKVAASQAPAKADPVAQPA